jgi:hypothetical protein
MIPLEDLGKLNARYQALDFVARARQVLHDAEPALRVAEHILDMLAAHEKTPSIIAHLRSDGSLIARMRSYEARGVLMDGNNNFIDAALHKIAAWRKTMQRIAAGEGVEKSASGIEYIASSNPVAMAVFSISHLSHYLSITQLIIAEVARAEKGSLQWSHAIAEMRRCATVIADYEHASGFSIQVH